LPLLAQCNLVSRLNVGWLTFWRQIAHHPVFRGEFTIVKICFSIRYYISLRPQYSSLGGGLKMRSNGGGFDRKSPNGNGKSIVLTEQLAKAGKMRGRRLSVSVGSFHRGTSAGPVQKKDLLSDYSEKLLANGYRAYLRGDRLDGRAEHFMEQTKQKKVLQTRHSRPTEVKRLRHLEGRFEWVLTLRENVTHMVLSACRINHYNRLRVQGKPVRRPKQISP
jgi:hypothetical protein